MTHTRKQLAAAVAVALFATPFSPALAQQSEEKKPPAEEKKAPAEEQKPGDERQHLGTISVTAERVTGFKARTTQVGAFRDAEILDVPATVNVIPRTVLDVQEAQGLYDALRNTAGVARSQSSGTVADNLSIRGVATENRTSFRLNGGLPVNNLVEMPMEDKERVEVLKGSSALYYGFTSPAGVVNMVMKRAGPTPIRSVALSGNEYGQYLGYVDLGTQFGDKNEFGARINAGGGKSRTAIDGYDGRRQLVAGAFDWAVTDKLGVKFDFEDIQRTAIEQGAVGLNAAVNNVITLPHLPDPTKLISGTWAWTTGSIDNYVGRADYYFTPDWAIMAEWGRAETHRDNRKSSQFLNYNIVTGEGTLRVSAITRGQAYVNENVRSEVAGRFGFGIIDNEMTFGFMENQRYQNGPSQQVFNIPQNLYNPRVLLEPRVTAAPTFIPQDITDRGLYLLDRIRIGQQWQVMLGGRRTDYTNVSTTGVYHVEHTSPQYAVIYKPWTHTSVYASYIEGLEEGGTAPLSTNNPGQVLAPGVSKQKEAGVRSEAFRGLQLSLAYFNIERASAYTNTANFFVLDGRTEYKGWEYSATGEFTKELSVYISGMFLDAKQKNAQNTALIGKAPDNTPDQTHSLFVEYRPSYVPNLGVNVGAYYIAKRFINNFEQGSIPGYTIFTAGANYRMRLARTNLTFTLFVENAGDKEYWSAAGGGFLAVGLPRTTKFSMKMDF